MFANAPLSKLGLSLYAPADGTRPLASTFGVAVTPAQNAYGAYAQLFSAISDDCQIIEITVSTVGISTAARDCIVTIGIDPAGGTSYDTIKIIDLCCGSASNIGNANPGLGAQFRFYLKIKAGSSIGAKASVNSATLTAIQVSATLRGRPQHAQRMPEGQFVDTYGSTPASSSGTPITLGTTSEGAWTQIGTLTRPAWYLEFGYGVNDAVQNNCTLLFDIAIGDASNKLVIIPNHVVLTSSIEMVAKGFAGQFGDFATNDIIYARGQGGPNAPSAAASIAVYAVGG